MVLNIFAATQESVSSFIDAGIKPIGEMFPFACKIPIVSLLPTQ